MMRDFLVVDWRKDFIAALAETLSASGAIGNSLVVFPHMRPRRYLLQALSGNGKLKKPFFPPEILSVGELIEKIHHSLATEPAVVAPPLDRAGLLFEVVQNLGDAEGPLENLPKEREKFFPWGLMLAELMEELSRHDKTPAALPYMEDEVLPTAAALLGRLDTIYAAYVEALDRRGWTTPGMMAGFAAHHAKEAAENLSGKKIYLAGFYALTGAEKKLFKALCETAGAQVMLHADLRLSESGKAHWSCRELSDWAKDFGAKIEAAYEQNAREEPDMRFFEAFDLHSQLKRMEDELSASLSASTAVVLPDTGSLMPVLHHLPQDADVNISMGYPLTRSPLYRLIDQVIRLQETSPNPGTYYWRDILELIRHPYLKTLTGRDGRSLRTVLGLWEDHIREADKYVDVEQWRPDPATLPEDADPEAAFEGVQNLIQAAMAGFEQIRTLADLAEALLGLCSLLVPADDAPENLWQRFPVDGECLFRLVHRVVPQLSGSAYSNDQYGPNVLFTVLRKLLEQERAPFEAEPLTGLQVLGWLETRLLHFDELHILEATDDKLPGATGYDPLLPDPLRGLLGLPDGRQRDFVAAYNFHRLMAGARRIHIYYRAGEEGSSPLSGRSIRSRFAEQLIWREEQKLGRILSPGDGGPITPVSLEPGPLPAFDSSVDKDDFIRESIKKLLTARPISPSLLDSYLKCQLRFYLERVARLAPLQEVSEEIDHAELGELVHDVLQRFFTRYMGKTITPSELEPEPLLDDYEQSLEGRDFYRRMPMDQRLAVKRAGNLRLENYLASNQTPTTILGLEREYQTTIKTEVGTYALKGRLDRIDRRADGDYVLDYKTGSLPLITSSFLEDGKLLELLRNWKPGDGPDAAQALADAAGSIQLPVYLYIFSQGAESDPANAGWVELRHKGAEKMFFTGKVPMERRREAIQKATPEIISFLIRHMLTAEKLSALTGKHCEWCPFKGGCPSPDS